MGGLWLDALKMTVIPLIIALLITGIVSGADQARAGGIAGRSILWFVVVLTSSAAFGALAMPALLEAFPLPTSAAEALRAGLASVDSSATAASVPTVQDWLRGLIPTNPIAAAANDKVLALVVFTAVFAFAVTQDRKRRAAGGRSLLQGHPGCDAGGRRLGAVHWRRSASSAWRSPSGQARAERRLARCFIMS